MKKINAQEFLYTLGYTLIIIPNFFSKVFFLENLLKPTMYIGIIILGLLFIMKNLSNKKITCRYLLRIVIFFSLCVLSSIKSGTNDMIKLFLIITSFPYKDFRTFLKKDIMIKIILILLVVSFYYLGLTKNQLFTRGDKIRYALGFSQPNQLALFLTMVGIEILYLCKNKKNSFLPVLMMMPFLLIIHRLADSRSSLLLMILVIITFLYRYRLKDLIEEKKSIKFIITNIFVIMTILSIVGTIGYTTNNRLIIELNSIFSSRIKWANVYYNYYGLNLLGHDLYIPYDFVKVGSTVFYCLDNAYLYFILHFGIIFWLIYAHLFKKLLIKNIQEKNYYLVVIMVGLLIYGLMENTILKYAYNPFLTLLEFQLFRNIKNKEET